MQVTVHRGTHQIGGCVTEIRSAHARIIIDFGGELPGADGTTPPDTMELDGLTRGTPQFEAVFLTHYHGDHVGLIQRILAPIPIYLGETALEIYRTYTAKADPERRETAKRIRPLTALCPVTVKDLKVTPLPADHSAFDALMYLVEGEGKRLLHTGDFRLHGVQGNVALELLRAYAPDPDVLITEGTRLSRTGGSHGEAEMAEAMKRLVRDHPYVFCLCPSTNIDRLGSLYRAVPRGRYFLCDAYQKEILDTVSRAVGKAGSCFEKVCTYGENLEPKLRRRGFAMAVRANRFFTRIAARYPDAVLVYSMWQGYLDGRCPALTDFVRPFQEAGRFCTLHSSGHASPQEIVALCEALKPKRIIPIHTEAPAALAKSVAGVYEARDGEVISV